MVDSMQEIVVAAKQQSHGIEQVTQSITSINAAMRDTVSATAQTQEATQRLNDLALGDEHLAALNGLLMTLEKQPADADALNETFRRIHSVKGAARMVGLQGIEAI